MAEKERDELQRAESEMNLQIRYFPVPGGAALVSCRGSGSAVRLPGSAGGLALREIRPYAFSSPQAAADHLPAGAEVRCAPAGAPGGARDFLGGPALREIALPDGLRSVGEYAFYNCTSLARVVLGAGAARIGNGAFMNCVSLGEIVVEASADEATCLPGLLADFPREVRVLFRSKTGISEWIFPEYYDESVEKCTARIFEHFIRGAGFRYRQCFAGDRLDAAAYDEQFPMARVEAGPRAALRIALARLRTPFRLSRAARGRYLDHLRENADAAAEFLIRNDDPAGLSLLAKSGVFTRESFGTALEAASRAGRAECLGVLLNERRGRPAANEKKFEL